MSNMRTKPTLPMLYGTFFLAFVLVLLASLPSQGAAIRSGIPTIGNILSRGRDEKNRRADESDLDLDLDVNMNIGVHMDMNGKERPYLASPLWIQKKGSIGTEIKTQSMPLFAIILSRITGGIGGDNGGIGKFGRKLLNIISQNPRTTLLVAGGALTVHKANRIYRSEPVRRATLFWYRCGPMVAHYKFTEWWLKATNAPLEQRDDTYCQLHDRYAPKAYEAALELKGLYIKMIQILSSRPDFVPEQYLSLFVNAQDSLPQWPIDDVKAIVDKALLNINTELSFSNVFLDIDPIALGCASIGQVHRAKIKGRYARELIGGKGHKDDSSPIDVAIKVMHPGSEIRFNCDFQVFRWLCRIALPGWGPVLHELHRVIMLEFNYRLEAKNLASVRSNMMISPFCNTIRVPKPLLDLCGKDLLMMELLDGEKLSESMEEDLAELLGDKRSKQLLQRKRLELVLGKEKLATLESKSTEEITNESNILQDCGWKTKLKLLRVYKRAQNTIDLLVDVQGYQIFKNGLFQGDPHPGNILKLKSTGGMFSGYSQLLGLIDFGQTKAITDKERLGIARVILALAEGGGDFEVDSSSVTVTPNIEHIATRMREIGFATKHNDSLSLALYAGFIFDSDDVGKRFYNCPTPQSYLQLLSEMDPLINFPDAVVFVARSAFILRGMGSILGKQIKPAKRWSVYAKQILQEENGE